MSRSLLVFLAACYAPTVEPGSPCDPGPCPSSLVCSPTTHLCEVSGVDADAATDTSADAWLVGYSHRKRLTITSSTTETLVDFAVSILEEADPDLAAHARADGSDIVFTIADAITLVPAERVDDGAIAGALEAWVRTTLEPGPPTILYMYYGGAPVASSTDAWSVRFAGVWHMSGSADAPDSTAHLDAAIAPTTPQQPATTAGIVGVARSYDGIDDSLVVADPSSGALDFAAGSFSYSAWVNVTTSIGMFDLPMHKGGSSLQEPGYDLELGTAAWNACLSDGVVLSCTSFGMETDLLGRWVHLTAVVDRMADTVITYVDRAVVASHDITTLQSLDNTRALSFGLSADQFHGELDEVHVYTAALPPSWIAAEYDNIATRTKFVTIGPEEVMP